MAEFGEKKSDDVEIVSDSVGDEQDEIKSEKKWQDLSRAEKQKERMETKLYVARDVESELNREELEIIRKLEQELSKYPAFMGIAPFGSVVNGYSNEESDIDIDIFCDYDIQEEAEKLVEFSKELCVSLSKSKKINPDFIAISQNVTMKNSRFLSDSEFLNYDIFSNYKIAPITGVIVGKKIKDYRNKIRKEIKLMSTEDKKWVLGRLMKVLNERDGASLVKRKQRMPELTKEQHLEILEKRKEMWKRRVYKVWGIEGKKNTEEK